MFPMEFDRRVLESLPMPEDEGVRRILGVLRAVVIRRILPYFREKRGTDPTLIARVDELLSIQRLEDEEGAVHIVSLLSPREKGWIIHIHERVFDYLAFVVPSDPDSRLGGRAPEEAKMLAFAEFVLRHQMEHILYPLETEREVIRSDVAFAMECRANDPTFYRMLRNALADEMTGLKGEVYLNCLDAAEQERPYGYLITRMLTAHVMRLLEVPEKLLYGLFPFLDTELKTRVLAECYRKSRDTSYAILRRSSYLKQVLALFGQALDHDEKEAEDVFKAFRDRWGLIYLFHELDLPEGALENRDEEEIFASFREKLKGFLKKEVTPVPVTTEAPRGVRRLSPPSSSPVKSLKDRIEEARNDPAFPRQALEVIDKNRVSAVGHSGPKYTELIETLLAIPWEKIHKIRVSPEAFEQGLERTHYGLRKPKEILCDFFTNLIWRYRRSEGSDASWNRTGSAFLFVGPPGVGKTSLAISIAQNLGIPYHKISLGGMSDEADIRGHGFTWEGSKPGAIVQGLIKMGIMNGMFIMDEADKMEKFAVATLLEILDPEQNHLFHDKYTMTTVDIDLSNCHFVLTANTLETVPPAVINRCEVVVLDRYSVEEKIAIAREHLIERVRRRYAIREEDIFFTAEEEDLLLRYLIKTFTFEPGVRELERIIRTLFLRILRKEILPGQCRAVQVTRQRIKQYLEPPRRPWQINEEDRVGEALALGINTEKGVGSIIPIQATRIPVGEEGGTRHQGYLSMVHATGNIQKVMDESRRVATTGILHCAKDLGIDLAKLDAPVHLHFMGGSTPKDGPSAGGSIALALASALSERPLRRDVSMTGEIDTHGRIKGVGGLDIKLETASDAGCKTMIIPRENLRGEGGIERLPDALKGELQILTYEAWKGDHAPFDYERHMLQVVAVDHIRQAADVAFIDEDELDALKADLVSHALTVSGTLRDVERGWETVLRVVYVKDPAEMELEGEEDSFWEDCPAVFLLRGEVKRRVLARFPAMETHA
ncbi:MAG: AAA family ATPase, partial [Deltaproteobacteria bacterium]|nr:AAA family ATPase [Deltaproteobacteria bacterium]